MCSISKRHRGVWSSQATEGQHGCPFSLPVEGGARSFNVAANSENRCLRPGWHELSVIQTCSSILKGLQIYEPQFPFWPRGRHRYTTMGVSWAHLFLLNACPAVPRGSSCSSRGPRGQQLRPFRLIPPTPFRPPLGAELCSGVPARLSRWRWYGQVVRRIANE
jgi:hypothetical protein